MFDLSKEIPNFEQALIGAIDLSIDQSAEELERFSAPIETEEEMSCFIDAQTAIDHLTHLRALITTCVIYSPTIELIAQNLIDEYLDTK